MSRYFFSLNMEKKIRKLVFENESNSFMDSQGN